jgi:CRISPR-associated protein Cmr3
MSDTPLDTRFIEPLDVLFLRGNKLFGDPGSYGESLVPPWPSVAAGALRSRMLADGKVDMAAFARGEVPHETLGTPKAPGSFTVTAFHLARRYADGRVEALIAPPADLVVSEDASGTPSVNVLRPVQAAVGLMASTPFAALPVLAETTRGKPASGYWLTASGWVKYLKGETPAANDLVKSSELWKIDPRVGVGLDADTRRAANGRLFSVQAVAMTQRTHAAKNGYDVGFVAAVSGARLPTGGTVRLGGDGRAAAIHLVAATLPEPDYAALAAAKRCRLVLATPGLFAGGWLPTGFSPPPPEEGRGEREIRFDLAGVKARLACAAVPRFETVSGWDLARWQPKPAQRAAPAGSVYWLDELDTTPDALRKLAAAGLWRDPCEDASRRAEGFNRIDLASWPQGENT